MTSKPSRTSLACSTALALFATTLTAQTAPVPSATAKPAETIKLEAFSVTGSNIKRIEQERALPMTMVTTEQLEIYDPGQPSDLLAALPMAAGLPGNEAALATQNARGDNANISFRGLSSGNTLILLNGRRVAPHPISWSEQAYRHCRSM
jgi:outer membrane receptor for ferrienterochelin and colicin